jgi:hypothetical protein
MKQLEQDRSMCPLVIVADPYPGSRAFLTPGSGSGIGFYLIPDPKLIFFKSLMTIFWVKSSMILCKLAQIFPSPAQK